MSETEKAVASQAMVVTIGVGMLIVLLVIAVRQMGTIKKESLWWVPGFLACSMMVVGAGGFCFGMSCVVSEPQPPQVRYVGGQYIPPFAEEVSDYHRRLEKAQEERQRVGIPGYVYNPVIGCSAAVFFIGLVGMIYIIAEDD